MAQPNSLERRLRKDDTLPKRNQETVDIDFKAGYVVRKIKQVELNKTRDKLKWNLLHQPVINTHKPKKVPMLQHYIKM